MANEHDSARTEPPFPVAGIGASAGGLHALEALVAQLQPGSIAFIVLQHLAPTQESALTEILARNTSLAVVTAEDGMPLEPATIYVAPPGADPTVEGGALHLRPPEPLSAGARHSIDTFFRSLALDRGALAIGVVLSGAGTDGTLGLEAIKERGGLTFVQEPSTAEHASMPQSALDAGHADVALAPAEIGAELVRLGAHPYAVSARVSIPEVQWAALLALLKEASGVDFALYKPSTLERRVRRRMALARVDDLAAFVERLRASRAELDLLYRDLLISVTRFFRDVAPFEALTTVAIPGMLQARSPAEGIRAWVPGCATGEEAYSIAILMLEQIQAERHPHPLVVFGTDVDDHALSRARRGEYPASIELDVSAERLDRFFTRTEQGYRVRREVRDAVVFARHDVGNDPPFSRLDLVSCRNVLIYMQPRLQARVVRAFHYALRPGGFLLLGTSESIGEGADFFSLVDRTQKLYVKKNATAQPTLDFLHYPRGQQAPRAEPSAPLQVARLADRKVVERFGPPGVVVDEQLQILQFRGRTGRYVEPTPGFATLNLLKLARPELLGELRTAVARALSEGVPVVSAPVRLPDGAVRIDVSPLPDVGGRRGLLVLFAEETAPAATEEAPREALPGDARVVELEREVATTRAYLQATIEELETTNEELQSSNEELQSANEELQSSNEELETSREELQATNEELLTLNQELRSRMTQLHEVDEDLASVLAMTSAAIVLIGPDLRIRRFSAAAGQLLNLVTSDVGRSVAHLRTVVRARDIEKTVGECVRTLVPREQRVLGLDGEWYAMRIAPYRAAEGGAGGASLEIARSAGVDTGRADERRIASAVAAALPACVAVLDHELKLVWANGAFLDRLRLTPDVLGRPLEDLWGHEQPALWRSLGEAVRRASAEELEAELGPNEAVRMSLRPLRGDEVAKAGLFLVQIDDHPGSHDDVRRADS